MPAAGAVNEEAPLDSITETDGAVTVAFLVEDGTGATLVEVPGVGFGSLVFGTSEVIGTKPVGTKDSSQVMVMVLVTGLPSSVTQVVTVVVTTFGVEVALAHLP